MTAVFSSLLPAGARESLFWRVALTSGALFSAAALLLAVSPATVSRPITTHEALVLVVGTGAIVAVNFLVLRRTLKPLGRLVQQMDDFDPLRPGARAALEGHAREIDAIATAFNEMVERLESERRDAAHRALTAEDEERRRIARELHDQVGQSLTLLLMELSRAHAESRSDGLAEAQETARRLLDEVREIATRLRPESLDDLGLESALRTLADRVAAATPVDVQPDIEDDLPRLSPDAELVVLRVAQEGLTNVVRHAGATAASVSFGRADGELRLVVSDNGHGIDDHADGGGIRGMRERAVSVGGKLTLDRSPAGGTEVVLSLPSLGATV